MGRKRTYRPVWVRLLIPGRKPCPHCGHLEPLVVMRLADDKGRQYSVDDDLTPIPEDQWGEIVGNWSFPKGWNHPRLSKPIDPADEQ